MKSNNIAYEPRLDHLRFLAAMLVFLFHWYHIFHGNWKTTPQFHGLGWLTDGYTGVSLFFVLSGYLLMSITIHANGGIKWKLFVANRVLRIFPLFSFIFFVALSLTRDKFRPENLLYFLTTNIGLTAPTSDHFITGAAWTISVEFTFYLIFPFLALFSIKEGVAYLIRLIFLLAIFKVGGYFIVERANLMFYSTLLGRLDQFLVGMLAAQIFPLIKNYKSSTGLLVVSIFGMLSLIEVQAYFASFLSGVQKHPAWIFWPTIEAVAWSSVILCYLTWKGGLPHVIAVNLEKGAKISFSMYLWHAVIIFIFQQIPLLDMLNNHKKIYMLISLVACLSCTLFVSSVSYKTIELPFLLLRKKYTH